MAKAKGGTKEKARARKNNAGNKTGEEDPDHYKCHNCGGKGHKAATCSKRKGKGRGKKGVYGLEEEGQEGAKTEQVQELGDLDLCAVEYVQGEFPART